MISVKPGGIISEPLTLSFIKDASKQRTACNGNLFNQSPGCRRNWQDNIDTALMKVGNEVEFRFNLSLGAIATQS